MAKTKALVLTTTPQEIITTDYCESVEVKELESVANWPTVALVERKPLSTSDPDHHVAGVPIIFNAPKGQRFAPLTSVGWVHTASGTTSGVQNERG